MVKRTMPTEFVGSLNADDLEGQALIGALMLILAIHECKTGMYRPTIIGNRS